MEAQDGIRLKNVSSRRQPSNPGDEIVITGLSGKFPNSKNVAELSHNLYNNIDMVDDREKRWPNFHPEIPKRMGTIDGIEKFDATFFGVGHKQANTMDPQCRLLIETAYEAIMDAGVCPKSIRGSSTGVYIGACFGESEKLFFYDRATPSGLGITGCSRAMLANRVSYCLGLNGPSFLIDTACSSSMYALDVAFTAMKNGECDAALVGGSNLLLHPYVSLQFARLGVLAKDGYCRPFDMDACGYTRSEAICVIFLQRAKHAKRIYGHVLYSKTNCDGFKTEGITYPSGYMQEKLLQEFYNDVRIDPLSVMYVEAHSTGTFVGDPEECRALDNIFCANRKKPLLVGSMKSNIGHTESSSGVCSIGKIILAFETGLVPPNINLNNIKTEISAFSENRMIVCTETTPLDGQLIGINSFGFGGANAHALFSRNLKVKIDNGAPFDDLPRLVIWAGRTEQGVNNFLHNLQTKPLDAEFVGLLHSVQSMEIRGNICRGFSIITKGANNNENATALTTSIKYYDGIKRSIVWLFSGMGSQWPTMGAAFMELPDFRQSIYKCHQILQPYGIDLVSILTTKDEKIFDHIVNSFVGIAAIQIGLVDILKALEIPCDFFIGHSVGELGCSYADGSMTAEQMILSAYARGLVSYETNVINGSMAAVGLGYAEIQSLLPSTIEAACHNNAYSTTISGPKEDVTAFVQFAKQQGIFAKEVLCSNIPYHSKYISEMGSKLLHKLQEIISEPKHRSPKWLSTSVPINEWARDENQFSSPEYHTNNLLKPVLFEETSQLLPSNAIVIEIAPHGLLQAIVKKSLPNAVHVPLAQRGHRNNVEFLLTALGNLFINGQQMHIERLYPPVEFPVSRGTAMISPLLEWDHTDDYFVSKFEFHQDCKSGQRRVIVAIEDSPFLGGHIIDGRCILPATYYLELVWETFSMMTSGPIYANVNIEFEDIRFLRATAINPEQEIELLIIIHHGSGRFEISESSTTVVTGIVRKMENPENTIKSIQSQHPERPSIILKNKDFYKELRLRGYHYNGLFNSIEEAMDDVSSAKIRWHSNWTALMDCMLQLNILAKDSRSLYLPTRIRKVQINAKRHLKLISSAGNPRPLLDAFYWPEFRLIKCGGIEIFDMVVSSVVRRKQNGIEIYDAYKFIPLSPQFDMNLNEILRIVTQLILETAPVPLVDVVEIHDASCEPIISYLNDIIRDMPLATMQLTLLSNSDIQLDNVHVKQENITSDGKYLLTIAVGCFSKHDSTVLDSVNPGSFLLSREFNENNNNRSDIPNDFHCLSVMSLNNESYVLTQKIYQTDVRPQILNISSSDAAFDWVISLKDVAKRGPVLLVAIQDHLSGLIGLVNCLRREPNGHNIRCLIIDDQKAPQFCYEHPLYNAQLRLGLAINIYRNAAWGTYRFLSLTNCCEERPQNGHAYANIQRIGDLSSFRWYKGHFNKYTGADLVNVHYSSINFRDVMLATGRLPQSVDSRLTQEQLLGFEYSGVNGNNERVMGMVSVAALATQVKSSTDMTWRVPENMTLREAATIPVVYITVYYAFFFHNAIAKGQSILIHAGSGGIGLAAIRVALAYGMKVFTTVSNHDKKKFVMDQFPELREKNIGNSRNCTFEQMIMLNTKGKGVDYVLNSLSDDKLLASVRCLGRNGCFLEIGKFDITNNSNLGLGAFSKETIFRAVFADNLIFLPRECRIIYELMEKDLHNGIIQPLPSTVFQVNEIENAYRYLSTGKHVGKVVIQIRENERSQLTVPLSIQQKVYCDPEMVYILVGGLGGFGLELADWLVVRGARKLVFSSRKGIVNAYQAYRIRVWQSYGCKVLINTSDVTTLKGCKSLVIDSLVMGAVAGIFNLAVTLQDGILENQTPKRFASCIAPKADVTFHLDQVSRILCSQLEYFVVFSSASCGRGNAGQSNYGMANSIMERIIEQRVLHKLPGKAIQWGAIGDVGLVAEMFDNQLVDHEIAGTLPQRISSCLNALDMLLTADEAIVSSMVLSEKQNGSYGQDKVTLVSSVLKIMGIRDLKTISPYATLAELGMDSLMSVEIKQILEREFELFLTSEELRLMTFGKFQDLSVQDISHIYADQENSREKTGFNFLFRNFGDELTSDEELLELKSNQLNKGAVKTLIIPGVEGVASDLWNQISKSIKCSASILQLMQSFESENIDDIVASIIEKVKAYFANQDKFYIVAHSFGALVALEVARILEASGQIGHILLIDGAPVFLNRLALGLMKAVSNEPSNNLENILILTIFHKCANNKSDVFLKKLTQKPTWLSKVDLLLEFLPADVKNTYSETYLRKIILAILNRVRAVFKYELAQSDAALDIRRSKLKSNITLVRPSLSAFKDIENDYELSTVTEQSVAVRFVSGDHFKMLENDEIIGIINEFAS